MVSYFVHWAPDFAPPPVRSGAASWWLSVSIRCDIISLLSPVNHYTLLVPPANWNQLIICENMTLCSKPDVRSVLQCRAFNMRMCGFEDMLAWSVDVPLSSASPCVCICLQVSYAVRRWNALSQLLHGPITIAIRARFGYNTLRDAYDSSAIRARYNIVRGVMCFRAIMNMSILSRCCRVL